MLVIDGRQQLLDRENSPLGMSDWVTISQAEVDLFADVTDDHAWIHVDERRAKESKFGGTIAHGYYTLSLGPRLQRTICDFKGFAHGLNYGLNRVRFPAPMPVGGRLRLRSDMGSVEETKDGALQFVIVNTFEAEGVANPVCVAETISRLY